MSDDITDVALDTIGAGQNVRSDRLDLDHVARLGEVLDDLPPVVLRDMDGHHELIDGAHRVAAHRNAGRTTIRARVVVLDNVHALEWATSANITHGRPLPTPDRKRSAERIITLAPDKSDRSIARTCGLSPSTIAKLREVSNRPNGQLDTPTKTEGDDGKRRPATKADAEQARAKAEEIAAENPDISTRDLAEQSGVSRGTAGNVKRGLAAEAAEPERKTRGHLTDVSATDEERNAPPTVGEVVTIIPNRWSAHIAASTSNDGRAFCLWMDRKTITGTDTKGTIRKQAAMVPGVLLQEAEVAARVQAGLWLDLAEQVAARRRDPGVAR